ncbi:MAG TPA: SBBP repeat-containing protein [Thermoanaerobaculia bacterium]|nr:SBBP repeat-containing protein [Thermoanaerobaculia bacterium]
MGSLATRASALLVLLLWPRLLPATSNVEPPAGAGSAGVLSAYRTIPPTFAANQGQLDDPETEYLSRGDGFEVRLSRTGATLALAPGIARQRPRARLRPAARARPIAAVSLQLTFAGASARAALACAESAHGVANYLLGADPARWRRGVPLCRRVVARALYPGIDLVWHFGSEGLEWDLRAGPGADLHAVRLRIHGARALRLDRHGNLVIDTAAGRLLERRPLLAGDDPASPVAYRIVGRHEVGLRVTRREARRELWIDPQLSFSSFLGGSASEGVESVAQDEAGNLYVAGFTYSADFPTVMPFQHRLPYRTSLSRHCFVSKIDPRSGTLLYSTYLGGSSYESATGIAVDPAGNIVVVGWTSSTDFPTRAAFQPKPKPTGDYLLFGTGFVAKLDPSGSSLLFSTFFGGSHGDGGVAVAVDRAGNVLIGGNSNSLDFPTLHPLVPCGLEDAFVAKFDPAGALLFSTCFGGLSVTRGNALAVDPLGNVYLAGSTQSPDLPVTRGALQTTFGGTAGNLLGGDDFIAKFSPAGKLLYSTYLGGPGDEAAAAIAVDPTGSVAVLSSAQEYDFPLFHPLQSPLVDVDAIFEGFPAGIAISRLSPSGSSLIYSTFFGGSHEDGPTAISIGPLGDVCVTGVTFSPDFPLLNPIRATHSGQGDGFISRLSPDGQQLLFSTLLGGSDITTPHSILCDPWGDVVVAGGTSATDFPVKHAFQPRFAGSSGLYDGDGFVTVIANDPQPVTPSPSGPAGRQVSGRGHLERSRHPPDRHGPRRRPLRRLRLPFLLRSRQPRAGGQDRRRPPRQPPLLVLLRRALRGRILAAGDRHQDRRRPPLPQSIRPSRQRRRHSGLPRRRPYRPGYGRAHDGRSSSRTCAWRRAPAGSARRPERPLRPGHALPAGRPLRGSRQLAGARPGNRRGNRRAARGGER